MITIGLLVLLTYGILEWLHIPAGSLADWLIGIASFWWLIAIVTVPWNIYFDAREVLAEANTSEEKNIPVDEKKVRYVEFIVRWSLLGAIALHIISGIGLYALSALGISVVGYYGSGATILLTGLRPALRGYQYLATRLRAIREEIQYPREDVMLLRTRVDYLEASVENLQSQIKTKVEITEVTKLHEDNQEMRRNWANLRAKLEQLEANNKAEHEQLSRETTSAISQLTEDSQFLNHARELIRFFKEA